MPFPVKAEPTDEALAKFLTAVREGTHPYDAARMVEGPSSEGTETLSRLNRFSRVGVANPDDPRFARHAAFAVDYAEALELWEEETGARIDARYIGRAFGTVEQGGASDRMLHNLALVGSKREGSLLARFTPLLEARVRHSVEGSVSVFPMLDAAAMRRALESGELTEEEIRTAAKVLRALGAGAGEAAPAQEQPALVDGTGKRVA